MAWGDATWGSFPWGDDTTPPPPPPATTDTPLLQVVLPDLVSVVVDLNDNVYLRLREYDPGDPVVDESWFFSWDAPSGVLAKAQDRPRRASIKVRILPQAGMSYIRSIGDIVAAAFQSSGNLLKVQWPGDAARFFNLFPSRLAPIIVDALTVATHQVVEWTFSFWVNPNEVGSTVVSVI